MDTRQPDPLLVDEKDQELANQILEANALRLKAENETLRLELERHREMIERIEKALFGNGGGLLAQLSVVLEGIHQGNQELTAQNRALAAKLRLDSVLIEFVQAASAAMAAQAVVKE